MKHIVEMNKPIVGYYGALASWLDWELLNRTHKNRQNYNFVYIGYNYDNSMQQLQTMPNVFYLGEKNYKEIYKYAKNFDICIIPFAEGDIAKATNPIKLFEYMSMKKPVVCTKDLVECYGYKGVLIAQNQDDFANKIDEAISLSQNEVIKQELYDTALQNTWAIRANAMNSKIEELCN